MDAGEIWCFEYGSEIWRTLAKGNKKIELILLSQITPKKNVKWNFRKLILLLKNVL